MTEARNVPPSAVVYAISPLLMSPLSFDSIGLAGDLVKVVAELGYTQMTPIQAQALPILLAGQDVIGQSATGSGKTAAFALPLLQKVQTETRELQALVLSPTRELAAQVAKEIRKLGRGKRNLQVLTLTGGTPASLDRKSLEYGTQVIVGTPGRVQDHLDRGSLKLHTVKTVVLDEADRMLDMGFRDKIENILKEIPAERQTALFSATFPPTIEALSRRLQRDPKRVTIAAVEKEAPAIEQIVIRTTPHEKAEAVVAFLKARPLESALVFCNFKVGVNELNEVLGKAGFSVDKLHGDLEQHERERVMAKFRNQSIRILVATDVAARGIDVAGLDAVINFDFPADPAQYVHRIGRTGRAGKTGLAVSLFMETERAKLERLEEYTGEKLVLSGLREAKNAGAPKAESKAVTTFDTLSISGGRKEKLRAGDILGALTGDAGVPGTAVGKIDISDHVSYVAIERSHFKNALAQLAAGKIKNRRFRVLRVH